MSCAASATQLKPSMGWPSLRWASASRLSKNGTLRTAPVARDHRETFREQGKAILYLPERAQRPSPVSGTVAKKMRKAVLLRESRPLPRRAAVPHEEKPLPTLPEKPCSKQRRSEVRMIRPTGRTQRLVRFESRD